MAPSCSQRTSRDHSFADPPGHPLGGAYGTRDNIPALHRHVAAETVEAFWKRQTAADRQQTTPSQAPNRRVCRKSVVERSRPQQLSRSLQAGGLWFEPSTAHSEKPLRRSSHPGAG